MNAITPISPLWEPNVIKPISPLWETMPLKTIGTGEESVEKKPGAAFSDIFGAAVEAVRQTDEQKAHAQYLLATGQLDNPAELQIATSKYEMSVSLMVQLRNKGLEAFNELMRISL